MIIGLSGKKQHGKDTVAKIIQYLMFDKRYPGHSHTFDSFSEQTYPWRMFESGGWQTKQFAGKLKQIVALLIGCTLERLEDNKFKETPLGEEWRIYYDETGKISATPFVGRDGDAFSLRLTPRKLLQIIGTEAGRNLIHPNIWVNALMADYKVVDYTTTFKDGQTITQRHNPVLHEGDGYPNWLITDVRFENEARAIEDRRGLLFRVERSSIVSTDNHPSETSLDNYMQFTDHIRNDGTIEDLIEEVKSVLTSFNIIKLF